RPSTLDLRQVLTAQRTQSLTPQYQLSHGKPPRSDAIDYRRSGRSGGGAYDRAVNGGSLGAWLRRIFAIGSEPTDSDQVRLAKGTYSVIGLGGAIAGVLWFAMYTALGRP